MTTKKDLCEMVVRIERAEQALVRLLTDECGVAIANPAEWREVAALLAGAAQVALAVSRECEAKH